MTLVELTGECVASFTGITLGSFWLIAKIDPQRRPVHPIRIDIDRVRELKSHRTRIEAQLLDGLLTLGEEDRFRLRLHLEELQKALEEITGESSI